MATTPHVIEHVPFHADPVLKAIDAYDEAWSVWQVATDALVVRRHAEMCEALAALPALTVPVIAVPLSSDLVCSADFAVGQGNWVNATCGVEHWEDAKLREETGCYWEAFDRVAEQPSEAFHEIQAKARLALHELADAGELENANPGVELAAAVLREIVTLRAYDGAPAPHASRRVSHQAIAQASIRTPAMKTP